MRVVLAWLAFSQVAYAAQTCVSVAAPGVPRAYRQSVAYAVVFKAGRDEVPDDGHGISISQSSTDDICFKTFDPKSIVTDATMLTEHQAQEADRQAAKQAFEKKIADAKAELAINELTTLEIKDVDAKVDSATTLDDLKVLMKELLSYLSAKQALRE